LPYAHALHALHPQDGAIAAAKEVLAERAREQTINASALERPEERPDAPSVEPSAAGRKPDRSIPIDIRFCTANDGARIAYSIMGEGPPIVKTATWMSHLQFDWESPIWRHWIEGFAALRCMHLHRWIRNWYCGKSTPCSNRRLRLSS
jgi:hypothetical protein